MLSKHQVKEIAQSAIGVMLLAVVFWVVTGRARMQRSGHENSANMSDMSVMDGVDVALGWLGGDADDAYSDALSMPAYVDFEESLQRMTVARDNLAKVAAAEDAV